ncbi:cation-translocating P-type ATPase [Streptomyces viridochromogenes]|uniref:cation-translocating P-type ATPase n=1 Tax=Streptomyces viridochromogenes TaxID=1938 RepID=UPI00069F6C14|nr:cation-translocating P-type ATPase [Streptomyces viridochromogenes]KOG19528.1 ATPase [Streptomyces viridochromogenes]KOG20926.1 ATPase [Streptomyces viridochromogenes]
MVLGLLTRPTAAAAGLVAAGPRLLARSAAPAVGAAAGAVAGTARAGIRSADTAARVVRVARNTLPLRPHPWRSGARAHLALRPEAPERVRREGGTERAARKVAAALAEHPDVALAYWDGGLSRLVVTAVEESAGDRVLERASEIAARHGLARTDEEVEEIPHPANRAGVRDAAVTLAADGIGIAGAFIGYGLRLPASPRSVTALVTLLRENPRFRGWLRARVGRSRMDMLLALANAAAHGAGRTPTALVLDGALRSLQLAETVARAAAFDMVHDDVCAPERGSVAGGRCPRPPLRTSPAQAYAAHAETGSLVGALATLLVKHDGTEAAEAVLAGSPKAARYGPAAFHAVLSSTLSRTGVLVRDTERLRQLEMADTVVLHPSALRTPGADADPWAETVLDAARRAGLRVVMVDDPALADFTSLADQVVRDERSLSDVVNALRAEDDGVVVTVARPVEDDEEILAGLLAGDVAVALTDRDGAVVWGADVLALHGLADVWRLLRAVPAARGVGRRSQVLARSGAALSGLLVAIGKSRRGRPTPWPGLRHTPVDASAAWALLTGVRAALGVAVTRAPRPRPRVAWHELEHTEVRERLEHQQGPQPTLPEQARSRAREAVQAMGRQRMFAPLTGPLRLARAVRGELDDPLTPVLAVGSAAEAILGSVVDALLVVGALDLNALVGGVQRMRAERALSGLVAKQKQKARVTTEEPEARPHLVDATKLGPGDVIELRADDVVPADARLVWEDGLEVDESALTGESLAADKGVDPTPDAAVPDRSCMVFEGTTVVAGQARAVVVDTGERTEASRAVALAARTPPSAGVQARLRELTDKALPWTLAGGAGVTALSLLRGTPVRRAVSGGVAVAVAAVPEGLPLAATVAQLAAARRLSHRGVLVRAPRTLEALGRMDTICFDKTGTLTENRLRLVRVSDADGTVRKPDEDHRTLRAAARACPQLNGGADRPVHATDEAVLDAAGPDPEWSQTEGLPFEAGRGYAAAVGEAEDGTAVLVVKGAPETVLPACADLPSSAAETAQELAGGGLRVLAVAQRRLDAAADAADVLEQPLEELEFTGLLALADVPRDTSTALVEGLRKAGVRPVMLTGDHPQTARAIAAELGWPEDTGVVTGDELASAGREERARMLRDMGVVARVAPEQKLQVVEALRDAGRVVGMVGDGANDAAAIRAADIGVGINARGSAAARNAADLVLTDDDMTVLIEAVTEGRALWHSVADAIAILIGGNAGEVGFGLLGTLLSGAAPLSTRQMLLVNLFTDLFPAMAVAVTPKEQEGTERAEGGPPPDTGPASGGGPEGTEPLGTSLLGAPLISKIRHRALTTTLGATSAWLFGRFTPGTARRSTTMALCAVVGTQLAQTLADRRGSPLVRVTALGSAAVLFVLVETPGLSNLFGCTPLGPIAWTGVAASIALAVAGQRAVPHLERMVERRLPTR